MSPEQILIYAVLTLALVLTVLGVSATKDSKKPVREPEKKPKKGSEKCGEVTLTYWDGSVEKVRLKKPKRKYTKRKKKSKK